MNSDLYRLVYCSRNRISKTGDELAAEIESILTTSRKNNALVGVTGALLYNDGNFAQVLEGSVSDVGAVFERVQCDPRHSEVVVVEVGAIESRGFADWAMAYTGVPTPEAAPATEAAFGAAFANAAGAGMQILSVLQNLVVQEDDWILADA